MADFYYLIEWLFDRPLILLGGLVVYLVVTGFIVWIAYRVRERKERDSKVLYVRPSGLYEKRR